MRKHDGTEVDRLREELGFTSEELRSTNEELRTANEELQRNNAQLRDANDDLVNVLASVEIAIIIVDRERRIRRFTPRACTLMQLRDSDVGRPIADLALVAVVPDLDASIVEVIETLVVKDAEVRHTDGSYHCLQIRPYRTADHEIAGAVVSFVDITSLRAARERAAVESEQFLDVVSHELRTPLSAILLWAQTLGDLGLDDPLRAQAISAIVQSARSEADLIDDLLDLALSRAGRLSVKTELVDPAAIVQAAVDEVRGRAVAMQIRIETSLASGPGYPADPRRLRQIAGGLIGNAIKFSREGGNVWVELARDHGAIALTVRDDGQSIAPEFLPRVFEPFEQADKSSTRAHGGLGIGLALVRHLVERHGGTIAAASDGTHGATFTVRLPAP